MCCWCHRTWISGLGYPEKYLGYADFDNGTCIISNGGGGGVYCYAWFQERKAIQKKAPVTYINYSLHGKKITPEKRQAIVFHGEPSPAKQVVMKTPSQFNSMSNDLCTDSMDLSVNMTVIPTAKPATVITTDEPTTVKDTATRARLRADFYRYILSSHYDHKLTAT